MLESKPKRGRRLSVPLSECCPARPPWLVHPATALDVALRRVSWCPNQNSAGLGHGS